MINRERYTLLKLVRPYLVYPKNDDDWEGEDKLPLKDDAPDDVKEAYNRLCEMRKKAEKRLMKI